MRRTASFVLLTLTLCVAHSANAQQCEMPIPEFEAALNEYIAELYVLSDQMYALNFILAADIEAAIVEFDVVVAALHPQDLTVVCEDLTRYPILMESPAMLIEALDGIKLPDGAGNCLSDTAHTVILMSAWTAELVKSAGTTICNVNGCVDGLVGDGLCVVACGAAGIFDFVASTLQMGLAHDDDCHLNKHMKLVQGIESDLADNLDVAVATRASAEDLDDLHDTVNDVAGVVLTNQNHLVVAVSSLDAIDTGVATGFSTMIDALSVQATDRGGFQELNLKLSVEAILQPGQTGRISTFQLPDAFGGKLELVREIVAGTILANQLAGQDIHRALSYFRAADGCFNNLDYKAAFSNYRLAYQEAVREVRNKPGED